LFRLQLWSKKLQIYSDIALQQKLARRPGSRR